MNRLDYIILLLNYPGIIVAQEMASEIRNITLQEVVEWATENSLSTGQNNALRRSGQWRWKSFKSGYAPSVTLSGTLPDFTRSFSPVTQPDGIIVQRSVSNNQSNLGINISQPITATGGQVFVSSSLQRFDAFKEDFTQYNTTPFRVGFSQPLFGFNRFKWDRRIEPFFLQESEKKYAQNKEDISVQATGLFFDKIIAQINFEIASNNLANNDTIYQIAQGRFNLGTIAENELLQLELNLMNSQLQLAQAELDLEISQRVLKDFIGFTAATDLNLIVPENIPTFVIDERVALEQAQMNGQDYVSYQRRLLEAEQEVARSKADNGFGANLFASFGLTNSTETFSDSYTNAQDQQSINIGFTVPIVDWGKRRSEVNMARSLSEFEQLSVAQDRLNFDRQIINQVRRFEFLRIGLDITKKSDEVGRKRYEIAKQLFLIGKTPITDLTIALSEKDEARRGYVASLRDFWVAYYQLRALTLYDFENDVQLYQEEIND